VTAVPERVRVYEGLRTVHLERFPRMAPARVLYTSRRPDFDTSLVDPANPPHHLSRFGVVRELLRQRYETVEINEPATVEAWPFLLAQIAAVRLRDLATRRRSRIVTYCIGNADPALELRARWKVPKPAGSLLTTMTMRLLVRGIDRLAFGTSGSAEMYRSYVGSDLLQGRSRHFEALPAPCSCLDASDDRNANQVAFVGSLIPRKGVPETMAAWDVFRTRRSDATLRIVGHGRLEATVAAWASDRPDVTCEVDPPRARVHEVLRQSAVLVLLSQPHTYWREQIGLPILEGLSHGCEIVTTSETGLADWLVRHGHAIVPADCAADLVASRLDEALQRARHREGSLNDLPCADQRLVADCWLMGGDANL
jgi:glycosyltransferase involved in cell wall biosynthesis